MRWIYLILIIKYTKNGFNSDTMAYRNQNYMTNKLIKQEVDKYQKKILDEEINYTFNSYGDAEGTVSWGTGTVKTTGIKNRSLTEIEVVTNSTDQSFIGKKFFVISDAKTDNTTIYPLYTDLNKTKAGIYVTIGTTQNTEETIYSFTSYDDSNGTTEWGTGTVKLTGVVSNGYTQVEVVTNSTDQSFIGQKFYITSDADANNTTIYQLYTDAGTTGAGIYVKISSE